MNDRKITRLVALFTIAYGIAIYSTFFIDIRLPYQQRLESGEFTGKLPLIPKKSSIKYEIPGNIPDLPKPEDANTIESLEEKRLRNGYKNGQTSRA